VWLTALFDGDVKWIPQEDEDSMLNGDIIRYSLQMADICGLQLSSQKTMSTTARGREVRRIR
jgi:hypothetical protein